MINSNIIYASKLTGRNSLRSIPTGLSVDIGINSGDGDRFWLCMLCMDAGCDGWVT